MDIISSTDAPTPRETPSVVSIGFFDGVHLGHQALLEATCQRAREEGIASAVVTFDTHPAQVLRPDHAPLLLNTLAQKLELLERTGVDTTYVIHFDLERSLQSADHFIQTILVDALRARQVIVGEDFHFGHHRVGNVALLEEMGEKFGFSVVGHALVGTDWAVARPELQCSSTAIRRALAEGRLADANAMLGRTHEMCGTVVQGDQRGRTIGFPTANVAVDAAMLIPANGIYAGRLTVDGVALDSAIYIGNRPTFYGDAGDQVIESHCLDWEGDLYGKAVSVSFEHHIRDDRRFDGPTELAEQLQRDCDAARKWFSEAG